MKPNFALTLSFDGIGLLHRSEAGWHTVGDVPLSHPDLSGALHALLTKARTLEAQGITTKLVIPNQQIRYLRFESDSRDIDILEAQVRGTLNGATPYHVSELAYDWSMTDGEVCVAAVAIETLTEAESFAVDHGFEPLSFVAIPEDGTFQGEPFFGETVHAGEVLTPGDSVARDEHAIAVTGTASLPEPEPEPVAKPEREPEAKQAGDTPPEAIEDAKAVPQAKPKPEPAEPVAGFQSARRPSTPTDSLTTQTEAEPPKHEPEQAREGKVKERPRSKPPEPAPPTVAFSSARTAAPEGGDMQALPQSRFSPASPQNPATGTAPPAPTPKPPPTQQEPEPIAPEALEAVAQASVDSFKEPPAPIRPAVTPSAPVSKHPGRLPFLSKRTSQPERSGTARPEIKDATKKLGTGLKSGLAVGLAKARVAASGLARKTTNLRSRPAPTGASDGTAVQAIEDERQRMTVFGARNPDSSSPESTPRYMALALTAGLLLFLVGVAAWAALFLEDGLSSLFRTSEDVQFAEEPAAIEAPAAVSPNADTQVAAIAQDTSRDTEELADEPLETLRPDGAISEELSPYEARTRYAATGIWQMSPAPSRTPLEPQFEDVYQTSLDPDLNFSDAVALPDVASLLPSEKPEIPGGSPTPQIDNVARDARGFVLATVNGTVSPDGLITVFAGAPPLIPPVTPERAEPDVIEIALTPSDRTVTDETGLRPRPRPDDLTDNFERSNNGGRTLNELQEIRPRLRPQSAQEQALAAAGISPEIGDNAETRFIDATDEAVGASIKPRQRPANFESIVEQTRETAAADPVSVEQRVSVAIPTTASVARAATERNQLSLRRVNLIGVYGSDGNRRALVRLPNGRYQKVQVGDRLDGGQVAAIDDDELRYTKRGQSVVLKMPNS